MGYYADKVLVLSPAVWYRCADASGSALTDSSGNGRNGTITTTANVSYAQAGLILGDSDTCLRTTAPTVNFGANLKYVFGANVLTKPWTFVGWFRVAAWNGATGDSEPALLGDGGGSLFFTISQAAQHLEFYNGTAWEVASTGAVSLSTTFMAGIVSTASGTTLYKDGVQVLSSASVLPNGTTSVLFGWRAGSPVGQPYQLDGYQDELAIFPSALTAAQILDLWEAGQDLLRPQPERRVIQAVNRAASF